MIGTELIPAFDPALEYTLYDLNLQKIIKLIVQCKIYTLTIGINHIEKYCIIRHYSGGLNFVLCEEWLWGKLKTREICHLFYNHFLYRNTNVHLLVDHFNYK